LSNSEVDITETIMMDQSIEQAIKASEQRIAELESELKRDSTTLDIYPKERPQSGQRDHNRGRSNDDNTSTEIDKRQDLRQPNRDNRPPPIISKPKPVTTEKTNTSVSTPDKSADKKEAENKKAQEAKENAKRNQNISKYYKKTDDVPGAPETAKTNPSGSVTN